MSLPTFHVEWTSIAKRDLNEIVAHIAKDSLPAALRIVDEIEDKAAALESLPQRGRLLPELERFAVRHYRELIVGPHRLIYRIRDQTVFILGVFDGRRNLEDVLLARLLSF